MGTPSDSRRSGHLIDSSTRRHPPGGTGLSQSKFGVPLPRDAYKTGRDHRTTVPAFDRPSLDGHRGCIQNVRRPARTNTGQSERDWLSATGDPARGTHGSSPLRPSKPGKSSQKHAVAGLRCLPGWLWDPRVSRVRDAGAAVAPMRLLQVLPVIFPGGPGFPHRAAGAAGL